MALPTVAQVWITNNTTVSENNPIYDGRDVIVSGATLTLDGRHALNSLLLTDGAVLTHSACTTTNTHKLDLAVANAIAVSSNSWIDVSGKGYLAQRTAGNVPTAGSAYWSGGSYGGLGGLGNAGVGTVIPVYGDYADPDEWGTGSGYGPGGGLVRLRATALNLDGQLLANAPDQSGSEGSGGGIYVAVSNLTGSGSIQAKGGSSATSGYGAGGGGRVAVYAVDYSRFGLTNITAVGGAGGVPGATGTVFVLQGVPHTHARYSLPGHLPLFPTNNYTFPLPCSFSDSIAIQFNKPIDTNSFTPDKVLIQGPLGPVVPTGISEVGDRLYRFNFPPQTEQRAYTFTVLPTLLDAEGFLLDQNANGIPGEPDDAFTFTLTLDNIPPRVTHSEPAADVAGTVDHLDVWFSEQIDTNTLTPASIGILNPTNGNVSVTGVSLVGLNRWRLAFPPQTATGLYTVQVSTNVTDLAGNNLTVANQPLTFNLVPVDLQLSDLVVSTNQLWVSGPVTVSWQGQNARGAALLGDWSDAVYLSTDDQWDINDILLATVPHTGGLASNQVYSGTASFNVPGVLPGDYRILIRADVANQEHQLTRTNNLVASGPIPVQVPTFPSGGGSFSGTLTPTAPSAYYAITVPAGQSVLLNPVASR